MEREIKDNLPYTERPGTSEELDYWSNEFGISKDELLKAVKAGKTSSEVVEQYVKKLELVEV